MSESGGEIYSLLIPLAEARLLVPRACVAEIAGYQVPASMVGAMERSLDPAHFL